MKKQNDKGEKHIFIGTYKEFDYFLRRYGFNPDEWICIDSYEKSLGRVFKKGYVHQGDTAYQIKDSNKLLDSIDLRTKL